MVFSTSSVERADEPRPRPRFVRRALCRTCSHRDARSRARQRPARARTHPGGLSAASALSAPRQPHQPRTRAPPCGMPWNAGTTTCTDGSARARSPRRAGRPRRLWQLEVERGEVAIERIARDAPSRVAARSAPCAGGYAERRLLRRTTAALNWRTTQRTPAKGVRGDEGELRWTSTAENRQHRRVTPPSTTRPLRGGAPGPRTWRRYGGDLRLPPPSATRSPPPERHRRRLSPDRSAVRGQRCR